MKLWLKLTLAMGLLTLIILVSNLLSLYQLARVNNTATLLADRWMPSIVTAEEMNTLFSDYRMAQVQYIYADDQELKQYYSNRLQKVASDYNAKMREYKTLPMGEEEKSLFERYDSMNRKYEKLHQQMLSLIGTGKKGEALKLLNGECRDVFFDASKILLEIVQFNIKGGQRADNEGNEIYDASIKSTVGILIFALLAGVGVTVLIVRGTLNQLGKDPGELVHIAQRVTDGDFNIDDGSTRKGVYGNIVDMVDTLKHNIESAQAESQRAQQESERARAAMREAEAAGKEAQSKTTAMLEAADKLEEVAQVVSSASNQLAAQIEQSERGASEQAARVTETATAMEEMNSTVLEVARNAGQASDVSAATRKKAEAGAQVVHEAVRSIQQVQTQSTALKGDMVALGEHAQSISQIMGVISDIADQTNLLALNAAIEAARAGEAGRGFAVVADEVRKLAEKTMASTTDVGNAIRAIQQSADKSIVQVDNTVDTIEQATSLAEQSGTALQEIVSMVDNTADQVRAIATASEQQSASSEEINHSITQVNTIAGETARAMQEAARAVSDLTSQAHVLAGLIGDMKQG